MSTDAPIGEQGFILITVDIRPGQGTKMAVLTGLEPVLPERQSGVVTSGPQNQRCEGKV